MEEAGEAEGPAGTETRGQEWLEPRWGRGAGEEIKELTARRPER